LSWIILINNIKRNVMNTKITLVILTLILGFSQLSAQTFEEFKKQRESEMEAMKQKQEEFISEMQNEFDEYVKQKDQEFADYLKSKWEQYSTFKGIEPPERPKPPVIPEFEPEPDRIEPWNMIPVTVPSVNVQKEVALEIRKPLIQKADEAEFERTGTTFGFFGVRVVLDYDQQFKFDPPKVINPATISKMWDKLSRANYSYLVDQLQSYKITLNLNDWAYYLMLQKFAQTVYPDSETGEDLLVWNLMTRSGFKTRVAYADNKLSLLIPSHYTLYSKSFLKTEGLNYYLMRNIGSDIFTYDKDYPDATNLMDFAIKSPLNLTKKVDQKTVEFTFNGKPYSFNFYINQNLIDFYKEYPQVDINTYFDAAVSAETKESIFESFIPILEEMSETEAISFLLKFVQTSFDYQTDQQQFTKEKFFFPEEVFFYPYSDCEDRSILFAYLVKTLMNNKVIGIEYPGHIATAVKFNTDVEGDYVVYNDEKYVVADATFVNAPIGMTMPEYRGKDGKIIEIDDYLYKAANKKSYWGLARQAGGNRGDNQRDIVFDDNGNAYLTGYFVGEATFGDYVLKSKSGENNRNIFLAKYDNDKNVVWAKNVDGNKNATGFSVDLDAKNDIYIAGSFAGKIDFENGISSVQCMDESNDVFMAKYSNDGRFKWVLKAGLDTYPQSNYLTYMTICTQDGRSQGTSFYSENEDFGNYGIQMGPMGLLYLTGTFNRTTGFNVESLSLTTNETRGFQLAESLKVEAEKLVSENCNRDISGLFAMLNHVKYTGFQVSGEDVQLAIDMNDPEFKDEYTELYNSMGKINLVLNNDGIVMVETMNGKSITIREMKIKDGSQLKLTSFESGDAQIDILSGVSVGKLFIWFDLNYVKMYKKNGNMLFDFASDHLQKIHHVTTHLLN